MDGIVMEVEIISNSDDIVNINVGKHNQHPQPPPPYQQHYGILLLVGQI